MALDELFTYIGIAWLADDINKYVKDSAKPSNVGKTPLVYNMQWRIHLVGRLHLEYDSDGNVAKIGELPSSLNWRDLIQPLGKHFTDSQQTANYSSKRTVSVVLGEREFDWRFANCGVTVFAVDCNDLGFQKPEEQPIQIGNNIVDYDSDKFVTAVGGLKVEYCSNPPYRSPSPDAVGGIPQKKEDLLAVCLGIVRPADLIY